MNTGLNENQTELAVLVLVPLVILQVLLDGHSLLDKHIQILRDGGREAVGLEDTQDLVTSDGLDLCNTAGVTKNHTDLGRGKALLGQLADEVLHLRGSDLDPAAGGALVRQGTLGDALSGGVHTSHLSRQVGDREGER